MSSLPVIVAVDGSDDSARALDWAIGETRLRGAVLRLVHVRQYAAWAQPEVLVAGDELPAEDPVLAGARARFEGRGDLPDLEYLSVEGAPAAALPELGSSAQLMVLGSRGRGGFASLLLGSNGMAAARDADCPVVVVPRPGRQAHGERSLVEGPRVVAGVSADAPDDNTLRFAFAAAARRSATLEVVSAFPWPSYVWTAAGDFTPSVEDEQAAQAAIADQMEEILAPYRRRCPGVTVELRVASGDAAGHIVAASQGAELVAVGRHHRRLRNPARLLGSVTHAVLLHAAAPVAVVPPGELDTADLG
ncbi:universal stress protein [Streptomyces sp. NPDC050560]|uniref:universal stress protein n=1 Tax=Streptomyces sp. NPDC050560 TaxID=3365630 RepID=UPI0037A1C5D8